MNELSVIGSLCLQLARKKSVAKGCFDFQKNDLGVRLSLFCRFSHLSFFGRQKNLSPYISFKQVAMFAQW